jgi:uncharacterized membrane protein YdfJ with MMPL/SSD domain
MAVAFSALLFSSSESSSLFLCFVACLPPVQGSALNLLAFYTVATVLFDTFVVRIFLVPALFGLKPEWNWWPGDCIAKRQQAEQGNRKLLEEEMEFNLQQEEDILVFGVKVLN